MNGTDPAGHGDKLTCFTAALASALVASGESRWWRPLLVDGPALAVRPAEEDLLLFEHHAVPPLPALGFRIAGSDDWDIAYPAISEQVDSYGAAVLLADIHHLPWQRAHGKWHAPHWLSVVDNGQILVLDDPLSMTTELGPQLGTRVPVPTPADLREWAVSIERADTVSRLREQAVAGTAEIYSECRYRWLEAVPDIVAPAPDPDRLVGPDALTALAARFRFARTAADFAQVDDLWQALRQRELLVWAAGIDDAVLDAAGREHWQRATDEWRKLPPLLLHARMRAASGGTVDTGRIVETLTALAEFEGRHQAFADRPEEMGHHALPLGH
ncbi:MULTISPECIES: hypothetical protein [unclassified Nocardia]|uniref:hypothetical protein n=1 Tax=unclassified Nocardia TaxID=2637762 RepID=UPI001CE3CBB4|nr:MULTISPECIES: hypothetical protein [unclassified Nocardia]